MDNWFLGLWLPDFMVSQVCHCQRNRGVVGVEDFSLWSGHPDHGGHELTNSEKWELVANVEEALKKHYLRDTQRIAKLLRRVPDEDLLIVLASLQKFSFASLVSKMSESTRQMISDAASLALATEYMSRHQKIQVITKFEG